MNGTQADATNPGSADRIERTATLRAPRSRVWRALTDPAELGAWFGVELEGGFTPGARTRGRITHPGYEHLVWDVRVERIEPETLFSWRWHPYAVDPQVDYTGEAPTLVEFRLRDVAGGTELSVVESGFDLVPAARRAEAYRMNSGGWTAQMQSIAKHVESPR